MSAKIIRIALAAVLLGCVARAEVYMAEFFESIEWQAVSNPADRESVNVTDLVRGSTNNPSGWLMASGNTFSDDFYLSDGAYVSGPDFTHLIHTTSLGLKNNSCMYIPIGGVNAGDDIRIRFDFEINKADGELVYGLWRGEPAFSGSSLDRGSHPQGTVDLTSTLSGSVDHTLQVSGGTGTVYLLFYKESYGNAVHIDNIIASAPGTNIVTSIFNEDFESHADWSTLAGGSLPASNTTVLVGNNADLRGPTLFNGWKLANAGSGPFNDDVAVGDGAGNHGSYMFFNAANNVVLGLKNWTILYKQVDLAALGGETVVDLDFDFFASDAAMDENNSLFYGIFDAAPAPGSRGDWSVAAIDHPLGAVTSQQTGSITLNNVDVSGFSGSLFVGFFKRGWSESIGIDNVELTTTSSSGANHVPVAYGGQIDFKHTEDLTFYLHASDVDGDPLTYTVVDLPTNGTAQINGREVTYTANNGKGDRLSYRVNDGRADSAVAEIHLESILNIPFWDHTLPMETRLDDMISRMTLAEKRSIIQFNNAGVPRFGIEALVPGECLHGLAFPRVNKSTVFPQAVGMAASWNPELIEQVGVAVSDEARAQYHNGSAVPGYNGVKGPLTFWSPVVNMARDPRWGRTQEGYGEDPHLVSSMVDGYVRGLSGYDTNYLKVAVGAKHFVANNEEHNRFSGNADVSEKQLREYFFPGYKAAVDAGGSMIMTAYNRLNGEPCVVNTWLVDDVLRKEWGFNGIVICDYGSTLMMVKGWTGNGGLTGQEYVDTKRDAAKLFLTRRGANLLNDQLVNNYIEELVASGEVLESDIDVMVRDVLRVRMRLGIFDPLDAQPWKDLPFSTLASASHKDLSYEMALESAVLLKNDGLLPLDASSLSTVAVVGPNATKLNYGTYSGDAKDPIRGLDGIENYLSGIATVEHVPWVEANDGVKPIANDYITLLNGTGIGTWNIEYFNNNGLSGSPYSTAEGLPTGLDWETDLPAGLNPDGFSVRFTTTVIPPESGQYAITCRAMSDNGTGGAVRFDVDGTLLVKHWHAGNKGFISEPVSLVGGQEYTISVAYGQLSSMAGHTFDAGWMMPADFATGGNEAAVCAGADAVVAFLGLSTEYEREAKDRSIEGLPQEQLDMLADVLAVNSNVVVVLHNGSSIESPELFQMAPAVLEHWYPGEQGGRAIADVIFGDYNPGGKLPMTFVKSWDDLPDFGDYDLTKGRTYLYMDKEPLFPFGYGLSYTTFEYSGLTVVSNMVPDSGTIEVSVTVTNSGSVDGDEVVQLYVRDIANMAAGKPHQRLKAFKRVSIAAGEVETVQLSVPVEKLAYWNSLTKAWEIQTGLIEVRVGSSSADIRATANVAISSATDTDADAMDDAWETAHGLSIGIDDGALDSDGDRISNLWEFLTGTDPDDPSSAMAVAAEGNPSEMVVMWDAVSNLQFSVLGTSNLSEGFQPLESGIPFPVNSYTDHVDTAIDSFFYKVKAERVE